MSIGVKHWHRQSTAAGAARVLLLLAAGVLSANEGRFQVLAPTVQDGEIGYVAEFIAGTELRGGGAHLRRRVPAVDQADFPEPETACGPAAMLNWLMWLSDRGVLQLPPPEPGTSSAQGAFVRIETVLRELRRADLTASRGGTGSYEIAAAMDRLAAEFSEGAVRLGFEHYPAPLKMADLLGFARGLRCGILVGYVLDDSAPGGRGEAHAVSLVAADRRGGLMLNNWGQRVYGQLRSEGGRQVFRAENADHPALEVALALCLVPVQANPGTPPPQRLPAGSSETIRAGR